MLARWTDLPIPFHRIPAAVGCVAVAAVLGRVVAADFVVTTSADAIPPPVGSLRWAIEKSQTNGERDIVKIRSSLGTIHLVAPLPRIQESPGVHVLTAFDVDPPSLAVIDGGGSVSGAFSIQGGSNRLQDLRFTNFAGPSVVTISSNAALDNTIDGCEFQGLPGPVATPVAAVRVEASVDGTGMPVGTLVSECQFSGFSQAVVVDGSAAPGAPPASEPTVISHNRFGLDASGFLLDGNDQAVTIIEHSPVNVLRNTSATTSDWTVSLDSSPGGLVKENELGVAPSSSVVCAGSGGPAVRLIGSRDVEVSDNHILCSKNGLLLGSQAHQANVVGNKIGSSDPGTGTTSDGILIDAAGGYRIIGNEISNSGGAGIHVTSSPSPSNVSSVMSCNIIRGQPGAAIVQAPGSQPPPDLSSATPLSLKLSLATPTVGKAEVYGGEGNDAGLLLGSVQSDGSLASFVHQLPVTNLMVTPGTTTHATEISFDDVYPSAHVATFTSHETSGTSDPLAANSQGLAFDVVRGKVGNLAPSSSGGVDLGPLVCLASLVPPGALPVFDFDPPPPPGTAYFYLARRRSMGSPRLGTYDPAMCLVDLGDAFVGPRKPGAGDCGP